MHISERIEHTFELRDNKVSEILLNEKIRGGLSMKSSFLQNAAS